MTTNTDVSLSSTAHSAFTRKASGLVRAMSLWDAAIYGIFSTGGIYAFVYFFPYPQALTPGVSVPLLIILSLVLGALVYVIYAAMGSAMPRAGGDYLYETRTLSRIVGFVVPWGSQLIFWLAMVTAGAFVFNTLGIQPLLEVIGWHSAATWLLTETGGFVITFVMILICWAIAVAGLKVYRRVQKWVMLPLLALGTITIIAVLAVKWNANFGQAFNAYAGNNGVTVAAVRAGALKAGYAPAKFSLYHTMVWVAVLGGIIPYTMFAAQGLLGEVKEAANLRRLFITFLVPGLLVGLGMLLLPWLLLQHVAGSTFINQYATAYAAGAIKVGYAPNINIFAQMLAPGKAIAILISLGFIAGGFGIGCAVFLTSSRIMMAMSLDGLLPSVLSKVSKRFYTPVITITIWSLCAVAVAAWFNYDTSMELAILSAGVVTSVVVVGVTALGAALFPYTAPDIYASAPIARYRLGGVPWITIIGAVTAVWVALLTYWALVVPAIGLTTTAARIALVVAFAAGVIVYYGWGLVERSRGVDVSLTTREVPPE